VAPHVVLVRGDVEIAADELARGKARLGEPVAELGEEIELVAELAVDLGIGLVAAGRNVEIVHGERAAAEIDDGRDVPALLDAAEDATRHVGQRRARDDGDAVIALLAVHRLVCIAGVGQLARRELLVAALDLLQAQDIGPVLAQEIEHDRQPQANRIDVPGGEAERHEGGASGRCAPRGGAPDRPRLTGRDRPRGR